MSSTASRSNRSATLRSPPFSALPIGASYSSEEPIAFSKSEGVGGAPFPPVLFDQFFQVALGDEAGSQKIQPDRLAMAFECFDGIHDVFPFELIDGEASVVIVAADVNTRAGWWACLRS